VPGIAAQLVGVADLDDLSEVHYGQAIAHMAHHGPVVGDEEVGEPAADLQVAEQVKYLGLDGYVQSADRLVADQEPGCGEMARAMPTLCLCPPDQLVGITPGIGTLQADQGQKLRNPIVKIPSFGQA